MIKVAYVEWEDHSGWNGPMTDKEIAGKGRILIHSAGIVVEENEEFLKIVQDRYTTDDDYSRDIAVILKKCITKTEVWEVSDA